MNEVIYQIQKVHMKVSCNYFYMHTTYLEKQAVIITFGTNLITHLPQLQVWKICCLQRLLLIDHRSRGVAGWTSMAAELAGGWS